MPFDVVTDAPIHSQNFYRTNHANHPIKTVGILGGGQLGLMLAQAALPLGIRCVFLEDAPDCPARLLGKVYSSEQFEAFARACDVYTLEFENTPLDSAMLLQSQKPLFPPAKALQVAQNRLNEKNIFCDLGIDTVPFLAVQSQEELHTACQKLGLPLVLKTCHGGYDGKGQMLVKSADNIQEAWQTLGGTPLIAEGFVDFEREVSVLAVRAQTGEMVFYPLVENTHKNGILAKTVAPAPNSDHLQHQAQESASKILEHLNYVGVMALEFFVKQGRLIANEIAPRVHNSGHFSIEGAVCSQFENHMRAVAGLPLGSTQVYPSVMLNIVGSCPTTQEVLAVSGAHLHLYDKQERFGRKLGHITVLDNAKSVECLEKLLDKTQAEYQK